MQVKAVMLHGKNDLHYETFDLREIEEDEILTKVICDSACMSTYKYIQRIPETGSEGFSPVVTGHELAAEVIRAGEKAAHLYKPGDKFCVQAAMDIGGAKVAPGYHFPEFGGNATYNIVPAEVARSEYILKFDNMPFYKASLCEPYACILFAFYSNFHTRDFEKQNRMGILEDGKLTIMGGCGPMGLGGVELLLNMAVRPSLIVVTDVNEERINYAKKVIPEEYAAGKGIELVYVNTSGPDPVRVLNDITGGTGFDDIFIMCPVKDVIEQADAVCGFDGCINFFSGPVDKSFCASVNFFDVHYKRKHIIGSASSGVEDMIEILKMSEDEGFRTEVMVTHVGGLNSAEALLRDFPSVPGGKKLIYSNIDMELTAIGDFGKKEDPLFQKLHEICQRHDSLWSGEAEDYLLEHGKPIL